MKKITVIIPILVIFLFTGIFFRQTITQGKLPVPSDTLVGMYHPWLDNIANEYPSGIPYKNFLITDPIRQQVPWRKLAIENLQKGNIHAWNPYAFSGTPLSTNIQAGLYYPLNIVFFFLSFPIAWSFLIIIQPLLSGVFFFLFLRRSMRLSFLASLFGAVLFMFCGFSTVWLTWGTIGQTFLWLPLILLLTDSVIAAKQIKKKLIFGVLFALVLVSQYFAGHSQIFLYSSIVSCVYVIFRFITLPIPSSCKKIGMFILFGSVIIFLAITSIHWISFLSDFSTVSRLQAGSSFQQEGFFIPFQHLIQFLIPDYFGNPATFNYWGVWNYAEFSGYVGITGLFFACMALTTGMRSIKLFWLLVTGIALLFAIPTSISILPYTLHIPIFSSLQPTRLLSVVDLGLCILAAFGFEEWLSSSKKKTIIIFCFLMAVLFGLIWFVVKRNIYGISDEYIAVTGRNIIFPTLIAGLLGAVLILRVGLEKVIGSNQIIRIGTAICLIMLSFYDISRFAWKFTPFTDAKLFFPTTSIVSFLMSKPKPFRIAAVDDRIMPPNVSTYYGIESVGGYDPLYDSRYETFIAAVERGEANITPPFGFNRIITPKNITSPLFPLLGVRYVLSLSDIQDANFLKVLQEGQTRLYEYIGALPRVYLLEHIDVETNPENIFKKLYAPSFLPGKHGIVEEPVTVPSELLSESEHVTLTLYTNNVLEALVQVDTPRVLYIGNPYNRGWSAFVDGEKVNIMRVNYLYMGIVVSKGTHNVRIIYE